MRRGLPVFLAVSVCAAPAAAKVEKVLVYSTQARVFHSATVTLGGGGKAMPLVDLPGAARHDTVRVISKTADVVRVEVVQTRGRLPRQEKTAQLVKRIEKVLDRQRDLGAEREVLQGELSFLSSLSLRREPRATRAPAQEGMFADTWRGILGWMDGRSSQVRARLRALSKERLAQNKALHKLQVEADALDLDAVNQPVFQVVATLKGRAGRHKLTVSYLADGVRWVPSYDLRYDGARRVVAATYYALVSQTTGEDWDKARLRFSTAMPTQLLAIPELPTWTLGRKRDFMPTPRRQDRSAQPPWIPPPAEVPRDPVVQHLQRLLSRTASRDGRGEAERKPDKAGARRGPDRDGDGIPDARDSCPQHPETYNGVQDQDGCPDRGRVVFNGKMVKKKPARSRPSYRREHYDADDEDLAEREESGAAPPEPAPPPPMSPGPAARPLSDVTVTARRSRASGLFSSRRIHKPTESVPWTDEGYRPPPLHRDLPAAAAKGFRFTLYAPGRHSVASEGKRQRIPLLKRELKVKPFYRIAPGASSYAYLMAELRNTTGRPILRGNANLFTGDMFSGRSWLNTSLPGKTIKLPLGVDDGVKVERHARQKTVVEGMIFKDDVSEYTVEIEIANHHRYAVEVELRDQIPVKQGRKVEVKGFSSSPKMKKPDKDGMITWKGKIGASSVKKLKFTFRITRPKDWELRQHSAVRRGGRGEQENG
jgi:hypothetical protein